MMIKTAGGPGLVSPIDFHERKSPRLSRSAWVAIGLVAAAHVGVGVGLYYQRFELPAPVATPEPTDGIFMELAPPPPLPPTEVERKPVAPNPPLNPTAPPTTPTDVLHADVNPDARPSTGPTISITQPVDESVDRAPPATQPQPQPPAARVIRSPSWLRQPSGDQMMRAYPGGALASGTAGAVSLNCMVEANGNVSGCTVTGETPEGRGFGRAAQSLSRYFRINPRTVDGAAEGSRVAINLRFVPPAD
ncbi:MAG: TonB family protein [Brevundimonas sp.]|nr:MAG: TonB family protein [Brevundimonas sp.]